MSTDGCNYQNAIRFRIFAEYIAVNNMYYKLGKE